MTERLPGESLVTRGLEDLAAGRESAEALLIAIGAPRLRRLGVPVPDVLPATPEHRLFRLLGRDDPRRAHSRYNALIRRLVSYERARERERGARARAASAFESRRFTE
jgi:hypothetical protein